MNFSLMSKPDASAARKKSLRRPKKEALKGPIRVTLCATVNNFLLKLYTITSKWNCVQ